MQELLAQIVLLTSETSDKKVEPDEDIEIIHFQPEAF